LRPLPAETGAASGAADCRWTVRHAIMGEHHSATWNDEAISEEELLERQTEAKCPRCGRELNPDEMPVIRLGGLG
jgi:hypothetical protein